MNAIVPSRLARQAISVGFKNHWRFRVVNEASYKRNWRTETLPEAPTTALERIEALKMAGISFQSIVIAHEAPRLLPAPAPSRTPIQQTKTAALPLIEILSFIFAILFQALLLDPALIVVLEDGTWLEVMTWYE